MKNQPNAPATNLRDLREAAGLTQQEAADRLGVDVNTVSRWERGAVRPQLAQRRRLSELYQVSVATLGASTAPPVVDPLAFLEETVIGPVDARVARSQEQWAATRRAFNANRPALAERVAAAYGSRIRHEDTTLLAPTRWLPDQPVDLRDIALQHHDIPAPAIDGTEREAAACKPLADLARPYGRYMHAVRDIARPRLLENRLTWRLTDVAWGGAGGTMGFADSSYFDGMDHHEAVGHEAACVYVDDSGTLTDRRPALRDLPFRQKIGDPFDLGRRAALASISTMVMRGGSRPAFLLHRRDGAAVASAGNTLHVVPTGMYQPSSIDYAARTSDFDLWRNITREISEELFGNPEHGGDGQTVDYTAEPFAGLEAARADGRLRVRCVGVGLDALTLVAEILTVAVLEPDFYDEISRDFVLANDEGSLVAEPAPFDEVTVKGRLGSGRMAPAAAGRLALAWRHHEALLD